ncbi:hypothetical protein CRG98_020124 [Punica granatum]|uniref:Uncharacterized protein n=1 Tax=Punica granatum TaxID=22663 RepID=A0A2I0JUE1_PUNGR|nr:hypothetical protein CRG98_020124 [Punica granatum]
MGIINNFKKLDTWPIRQETLSQISSPERPASSVTNTGIEKPGPSSTSRWPSFPVALSPPFSPLFSSFGQPWKKRSYGSSRSRCFGVSPPLLWLLSNPVVGLAAPPRGSSQAIRQEHGSSPRPGHFHSH